VVNYAANQSQCYVPLTLEEIRGQIVRMQDLLSPIAYEHRGDEVLSRGLYLDLPAWGYHVFQLTTIPS
jgi:hypothetical protein